MRSQPEFVPHLTRLFLGLAGDTKLDSLLTRLELALNFTTSDCQQKTTLPLLASPKRVNQKFFCSIEGLNRLAMPTRKQDKRLRRCHIGITTLFALPLLLCFALAWSTSSFWPAAIGFGVIALVGLVFQELRFRRYHCLDCGALLPYTPAAPGARIEYVCPRCDVVWNSGFVAPQRDSI